VGDVQAPARGEEPFQGAVSPARRNRMPAHR
jgi:hypothetical protein